MPEVPGTLNIPEGGEREWVTLWGHDVVRPGIEAAVVISPEPAMNSSVLQDQVEWKGLLADDNYLAVKYN